MNKSAYIISSMVGAAFTGAVAGAAASDSSHPVIKGAIVGGVVNGLLAAAIVAGYDAAQLPKSGVSGEWQATGAFS